MKKASSDVSHASASCDVEAPDVFPLEMTGIDMAALPRSSRTFGVDGSKVLRLELLDSAYIEDYTAKHPQEPSRKTDNGLDVCCPPGVMPASPAMATRTEAPNTMSIPEEVAASRQPGAEHVSGILRTTLSSHDIDGDDNLSTEHQDEIMQHLNATLVEPPPIAKVVSDAELQAAYQPRSRKLPWRKLLWTGGLILVGMVIVIVAVILTRPDPDSSKQIFEALNPVLPETSKESIKQVDTPQYQAFEWLKTRDGVDSLSDDRIRQLYALATIYYATNGTGWDSHFGWLTNDDECNWYFSESEQYAYEGPWGISMSTTACTNDVLTTMDLNSNNLNGTLPPEIGMLSSLKYLSLASNYLIGTIPSSLVKLTSLEYMGFSQMGLTGTIPGTIPSFLGQLTSLKYLILSEMGLTGSIPSFLGQLTSLGSLVLSSSSLTGTIPSSLGQLTSLKYLVLSDCGLNGTIPFSLGQLTSLVDLSLYDNAFTGTIPSSLGVLTSLENLSLEYNVLTGTIPSSLGQLTRLFICNLNRNALNGTMPSSLGLLSSLYTLQMHNNALTGTIPSSLGQLARLGELQLENNTLTGTVPSSLGRLTSLSELHLNGNALTGTIPSVVCALEYLGKLVVDCGMVTCGCADTCTCV